jgi:hypothetical protein
MAINKQNNWKLNTLSNKIILENISNILENTSAITHTLSLQAVTGKLKAVL